VTETRAGRIPNPRVAAIDMPGTLCPIVTMPKTIKGQGRIRIGETTLEISFSVPEGKCPPQAILPDVQRFADKVSDHAAASAEASGARVQCGKGCGACCRQMAPVSPAEARHLKSLVDKLPQARAEAVRARFQEARARIEAAGLRPQGHPESEKASYREYALAYFRAGVPCPFLEDESCSIHADRPLVCREYLVTSPPAACAALGSGQVRQVPVPLRVWAAFGRSVAADRRLEWMPLIESLAYFDGHPDPPPSRTGPERVEAFLGEIKR